MLYRWSFKGKTRSSSDLISRHASRDAGSQGPAGRVLAAFGGNGEGNFPSACGNQAVFFQELGHYRLELVDQRLEAVGTGGEPGHVLARGDPYRGLCVPFR